MHTQVVHSPDSPHEPFSDELNSSMSNTTLETGNPDQEQEKVSSIEDDAELNELRRVRRTLAKMNQGVENMQRQMKYFNSNVSQTTQLLDIWVRILSQTSHNHSFLADRDWYGGSADTVRLNNLVQRDLQRQEERERRLCEERLEQERRIADEAQRARQREASAAAAAIASASRPPVHPGFRPGRRQPLSSGARGRGSARGMRRGAVSTRGRGGVPHSGRGKGRPVH